MSFPYIDILYKSAALQESLKLPSKVLLQDPVVPVAEVTVLGLVEERVRLDVGEICLLPQESLKTLILQNGLEPRPSEQFVDDALSTK